MEKIAEIGDFKGDKLCVQFRGKSYALFKVGKRFYCIDGKCTHVGGPLCQGFVDGKIVTCPWHGSKFDVTTGKVVGAPAKKDEKSYKVTVKGDDILIDL